MSFLQRVVGTVAKGYQSWVAKDLAKYGLLYEDVIMHENPDVQAALKYIPPEEVEARNRRLRRALDMSFKHKTLPKEIQAVQDTDKFYLNETMDEIRALREEREKLQNSKFLF
mmetsp:Transcript_5925/g.6812  ORF Transcript_5925/g.6812 Transcript_5925/m.6812 type:complete len:113 (-) Transcript_5925:239-577(-)|eukprot:CAMPEP_0184013604 /NCGR_PEP_ID=MMETSP0954-20121128/5115_1 /TAXON_ID=627963 /ORGANISM="Aplanochytrium sp, Strain PBS07" /LENGTH=112 /DNA_ID=CAMNT_0026293831 /DNA_START=128 /DNA_END=466 /DNA_ORIENTATION=+